MKLKESAGLDIGTRPSSDFSESDLQPQASQLHPKVKIVQGEQKVPLRPVVTKKAVNVGEGQNQETIETRGYRVKELFHFVD